MDTAYTTIAYSLAIAAVYALFFYLKNMTGNTPKDFDVSMFCSTILVGGAVGIIGALTGYVITYEYAIAQIGAYGFVIVIVDQGIHGLQNLIAKSRSAPIA
jgi:RsiW-degrading membrane proteinase PrsW (M82 family)